MFTCEVRGKVPVKVRLWTLCPDCFQLYATFLEFVEKHNVDVKDLEPLKQILRTETKEIGLVE